MEQNVKTLSYQMLAMAICGFTFGKMDGVAYSPQQEIYFQALKKELENRHKP